MELTELGTTGLVVSAIGMGCNKLGSFSAQHTRRSAVRLVRAAVDDGIRLFDTADAYGSGASERILGEALRGEASAVVATKVGYRFAETSATSPALRATMHSARRVVPRASRSASAYSQQDFSATYVRHAVEGSLRRLQRDRIDILQFHGPPAAARSDLPEVVTQLMSEGAVRSFGVGCERLDVAESWLGVSGLSTIQLPFGVLDPQAASDLIPRIHRAGIGVIVRGVLGGGVVARFLRGEDPGIEPNRVRRLERLRALAIEHDVDMAQLLLWFAMASTDIDVVLIGLSNPAQLRSAIGYATAARPSRAVLDRIAALSNDVDI